MERWVVTGALVALTVCVLLLAVVVLRLARAVTALRAEWEAASPSDPRVAPLVERGHGVGRAEPDYVITQLGEPESDLGQEREPLVVPDRIVLSATLGEPLVRAMAFSHGLRRALSAESRNRIGFEVRREVKRSRKVRRREMREAWRRMKSERAAEARSGSSAPDAVDGRDVA